MQTSGSRVRLARGSSPATWSRGILCSRVPHFLSGEAIDVAVAKMAAWLKPGGRLYIVTDTPYGIWRNFIPVFEQRKREGARWRPRECRGCRGQGLGELHCALRHPRRAAETPQPATLAAMT